ncbi:MAG: protein phosphatase CheZ [Syntrophobacteraceae bacterium]|nr:protein phosphatase CheZ [Syntrophobacteraceae bacterium]
MIELETQDWDELVRLLREAEEGVAAMGNGESAKEMEKSRRALVSFHATAAMLGLGGLEKAGVELETFLSNDFSSGGMDSIVTFGFAIGSVIEGLEGLKKGKAENEIGLEEISELLSPPRGQTEATGESASEVEPGQEAAGIVEAAPGGGEESGEDGDLGRLKEMIGNLGGELTIDSDEHCARTFKVTFTGSAETLRKIEKLLSDGQLMTSGSFRAIEEATVETVVTNVNDFIEAFSNADMETAQGILLKLADQPKADMGLYKEIGTLARGLHDSIGGFLNTLDPSLQEIVEDKIPDSGNRLEHILEMTEKSALTTLDQVEAIQARLTLEKGHVLRLREILGGLKAIGDSAGEKLAESSKTLDAVDEIIAGHRSDLNIIMSAQDFQDLSGQVIQKITKLLKDIEGRLVGLIRTFGVKETTGPKKVVDELYGPVHGVSENAVHSQDEVDSLLSEFGF